MDENNNKVFGVLSAGGMCFVGVAAATERLRCVSSHVVRWIPMRESRERP